MIIRLGSFYLQGWVAWGEREHATVFTPREAAHTLKRLHKLGLRACSIEPAEPAPT